MSVLAMPNTAIAKILWVIKLFSFIPGAAITVRTCVQGRSL